MLLLCVCVGELSFAAWTFQNPVYFEHVNLIPFNHDPAGAIWRALALVYQPGYLNILPLYMVLLAWVPLLFWLMQRHIGLALIASVVLWGVGGFLGALARYEVGLAWPAHGAQFPAATFTINTSGAFLLGLLLTVILEHVRPGRYLRPFACVGVLGAWTTMSTLAAETDLLVKGGHAVMAVAYAGATLAAGLGATACGIGLARRWAVPG